MKSSFIFAAIAVASTASAYQCPDSSAVNDACRSITVTPLVCSNPNVNVEACNAKQCNQPYIDNYAACQCRRSNTGFYENSVNVQGLLKRCGLGNLTNPFGNPDQYRPGQGTQTFSASSSSDVADATHYYNGTTYYGGETGVVSGTTHILSATAIANGTLIMPGTTTWVSETPGISQGTSTVWATGTAVPVTSHTAPPVAVETTSAYMSGGSIAGTVLGLVGAAIIAGLLGLCWRKTRKSHMTVYPDHSNEAGRGPTRTVVTEKIEPVVVKSVPTTGATTSGTHNTGGPTIGAASTNYNTAATNTNPNVSAYNTTHSTTTHPTTTGTTTGNTSYNTTGNAAYNTATDNAYNTTTAASGYNTQPRVAGAVSNTAQRAADAAHNATH